MPENETGVIVVLAAAIRGPVELQITAATRYSIHCRAQSSGAHVRRYRMVEWQVLESSRVPVV